jgi:hypothetical protein
MPFILYAEADLEGAWYLGTNQNGIIFELLTAIHI